jgi:hypothetical protein
VKDTNNHCRGDHLKSIETEPTLQKNFSYNASLALLGKTFHSKKDFFRILGLQQLREDHSRLVTIFVPFKTRCGIEQYRASKSSNQRGRSSLFLLESNNLNGATVDRREAYSRLALIQPTCGTGMI